MSDILQAMSKRARAAVPSVDAVALDDAKLHPVPDQDQQDEFSKIGTRVLREKKPAHGYVLAVASNVSGEGGSFVSYNLARLLSIGLGQRTLWIDANFRSPHPRLRLQESGTLAEYLEAPGRSLERESVGMLSVMAGGLDLETRKAELASDNCRQVFRAFSEQYDFVVVDCPPILEAVETAWLGSAADGMIVVVEARRLKSQIVNHGLRLLKEQNVRVLGTVLNKRRYELPKAIYDRV